MLSLEFSALMLPGSMDGGPFDRHGRELHRIKEKEHDEQGEQGRIVRPHLGRAYGFPNATLLLMLHGEEKQRCWRS